MQINGMKYLLSLRLMAIVPFFLVNLLAGCTTVSLGTFIWTTSVGIIPISVIFSYIGSVLGEIRMISDIVSIKLIGALVFVGMIPLFPVFIRKIFRRNI